MENDSLQFTHMATRCGLQSVHPVLHVPADDCDVPWRRQGLGHWSRQHRPSGPIARTCGLAALLNQARHKLLSMAAHLPGPRVPIGQGHARLGTLQIGGRLRIQSASPHPAGSYQKPWVASGLHDRATATCTVPR